jgi:hypothetical protein
VNLLVCGNKWTHHHIYRIWTPTPVLIPINLVYILLGPFNIIFQFRSISLLSAFRTQLIMHFSSLPHVLNNPPTPPSLITSLPYHFVQLQVATGLPMQVSPLPRVTCFFFGPNALQFCLYLPLQTVSLQHIITGANTSLTFKNRSRKVKWF